MAGSPTLEVLRQEHRQWHREHQDWRTNLNLWQRQIGRVEAIAYELEMALPQRGPLHDLRRDIEGHEQALRTHERHLQETNNEDLTEIRREHEALRRRHQGIREHYLAFRERHHAGMAKIQRLLEQLG